MRNYIDKFPRQTHCLSKLFRYTFSMTLSGTQLLAVKPNLLGCFHKIFNATKMNHKNFQKNQNKICSKNC